MQEKDIQNLIHTAMESLREMMDVNTIIGDIIESESGVTVIPVSRVSCGFLAGGGETACRRNETPFIGGSGAGLSLQPVGFLVIHGDQIRLIPVCGATPLDKAIEAMPLLAEQIRSFMHQYPTEVEDKK